MTYGKVFQYFSHSGYIFKCVQTFNQCFLYFLLKDDASMDEEEDLLDDDEPEKPPVFTSKEETETKPDAPEYDEETQKLVDGI